MPRRTTPLLSEAATAYLRFREPHTTAATQTNTRCHVSRFIAVVGDRQCHTLTQGHVDDWATREASRMTASSWNKSRARTRDFLRFCVRRGWLINDMMEGIPTRTPVRRERMRLSAVQLRDLVEATSNERDRGLLATAIGTALRHSDLVKMRVGDVSLDAGYIRVRAQKTQVEDELPITAEVDAALRRWMTEYARLLALTDQTLTGDMTLFPPTRYRVSYRHGGEHYRQPQPYDRLRHSSRIVHDALTRIGVQVEPGTGFHLLRRSTARLVFDRASERGMDAALRVAGALLQHQDLTTTQQYIGVSADRRRRDELMRGVALLAAPDENVVPLTKVARS